MQMHHEKLIAKIIDLEERANAHSAECQKLLQVPKHKTEASKHHRSAARLQSRIQSLIKEIALWDDVPFMPIFPEDIHSDRPHHP